MAKGKVTVSVEANTSKASASIRQLQQQAEGLNMGKALKGLGAAVPGLDKLQDAVGKLGNLTGPLAAAGGVAAGVAAVSAELDRMVKAGEDTARASERIGQGLAQLERNLGGTGRVAGEVTKELQLMAANGVTSLDDLAAAQRTLMVANGGNQQAALSLVRTYDDLAAGTGMAANEWAKLTAKVIESGEADSKTIKRLANQGVPIYRAMADVIGEAETAAVKAGQKGIITTERWLQVVDRLASNYKGLSATLSSNTMEGAQATYEASRGLKYETAAEGYDRERIAALNELSNTMQQVAKDPVWQEHLRALGALKAQTDNFGLAMAEAATTIKDQLMTGLLDTAAALVGQRGAIGELAQLTQQVKASQELADLTRGYAEAKEGKLSSQQVQQLIDAIRESRNTTDDKGLTDAWQRRLDDLGNILSQVQEVEAQRAAADKEAARQEGMRQAALKYGSLEDKVAAVSGRNGVPIILDPAELQGVMDSIKQGLLEGRYSDMALMEEALKTLEPLAKEYEAQTKAAAKAEEELARARERSAKAAAEAERKLEGQRIEGKADLARQLNSATDDYNSLTSRLEELRADNALRLAEEEHGIYRDKWRDLQAAGYDRQEAKLIDEQRKAAQRMDEASKALRDYDAKWASTRSRLEGWLTGCVAGNVVKVRGTAVAG